MSSKLMIFCTGDSATLHRHWMVGRSGTALLRFLFGAFCFKEIQFVLDLSSI